MTPITDEQLREACNQLAFNPLGTIEPELPADMQFTEEQAENGECLENDRCYDFVTSGEWVPEPGPLGFALGHPSPGWKWLRGLVDHVAVALEGDRFATIDPATIDDFYKEQAALRAGSLFASEALVIVADIEVTGHGTVSQFEYAESSMQTRTEFTQVAFDLVEYAGFLVCREVFAELVNARKGPQ
jgi:hypothetical protein